MFLAMLFLLSCIGTVYASCLSGSFSITPGESLMGMMQSALYVKLANQGTQSLIAPYLQNRFSFSYVKELYKPSFASFSFAQKDENFYYLSYQRLIPSMIYQIAIQWANLQDGIK